MANISGPVVNPDSTKKVHFASLRLRNNAGMDFPLCYASAALLDLDKSRLPLTVIHEYVTCAHCAQLLAIGKR